MAKSPELLEGIWCRAWEQATETALGFYEKLQQFQREAFDRIAPGQSSSLSGQGRSWQAADGRGPDYSPSDIQQATVEAVRLYRRLAADLDTDDEEAIYNAGLAGPMEGVTRFRPDFSCRY